MYCKKRFFTKLFLLGVVSCAVLSFRPTHCGDTSKVVGGGACVTAAAGLGGFGTMGLVGGTAITGAGAIWWFCGMLFRNIFESPRLNYIGEGTMVAGAVTAGLGGAGLALSYTMGKLGVGMIKKGMEDKKTLRDEYRRENERYARRDDDYEDCRRKRRR